MTDSPRRSQLAICYSSTGATQAGFGTGSWLANGAIDARFSLAPGSEPRLEYVTKADEILTCTGQDILKKILLAKSIRISFELQIDIATLAILLEWGFGATSGSDILMLSESEFQPAATTFVWAHDDAAGVALKLGDMVLDEIEVTGEVSGRINCTVAFRGHGTPVDVSGAFTVPECTDVDPVRLSDGDFILDGTPVIDDIRRVSFRFSNGLLFDEDAHTAASVDIVRMERADRREELFTFTIYGQPGDANHLAALAFTEMDVSWQIGDGTPGILIAAANAILEQAGGPTHGGEALRSVLELQALPTKISGDADTPVKATILP